MATLSSTTHLAQMLCRGEISQENHDILIETHAREVKTLLENTGGDGIIQKIPGNIVLSHSITRSRLEATSKVFNTPELLEHILSYLYPVELSRKVCVCKGFLDTIKGSVNLQRQLFLIPDFSCDRVAFSHYFRYGRFMVMTKLYELGENIENYNGVTVRIETGHRPSLFNDFRSDTLITQPPTKHLLDIGYRDSGPKNKYVGDNISLFEIHVESGITVGHLKTWWAARQEQMEWEEDLIILPGYDP